MLLVKERSFSLLRPVKFYLRATTGQSQLNHLIILNAYKENFGELNLKDFKRNLSTKTKTTQDYHFLGRYKSFDSFLPNVFIKVTNFQTIRFLF